MKIKLHLYIFFLLFATTCFSQFSKTHYIPPLSSGFTMGAKYIYISSPSTIPVNFIIKQMGGASINGTVSRDFPYVFNIDTQGNPNQLFFSNNQISSVQSNKGYIVEAGDLVYVSVRIVSFDDNHAGEIVSKGLAALGTSFRVGGFLNTLAPQYGLSNHTFVSILATENNTVVSFDDIKPGVILINNATAGNTPASIVLNSGQSFVMAVTAPTIANKDGLIGSLITSDKPIAVNCGSIGGSNGEMQNIDFGFDQIVSAERTGKDYIFIKSTGLDNVERALLIAHEDNTEIFINGNTGVPNYTINAGEYIALTGSSYNASGNLYVKTNKNIFAYQSVGDNSRADQANQEMFFVPPLSCQTPKIIDNIPFIDLIGDRPFTGRVTITTKVGSTLNFIIDTIPYTLTSLPAGITVIGPTSVTGNNDYECYTLTGISGNVSVFSTTELYLAAYGSSGAATFGGYYSGFTFKPEITYQSINTTASNCIPNVNLQVSSLSGFNTFQWYFNDVAIPGAINSSYNPTQPGYYFVSATISACGVSTVLISDKIPVSNCASNADNDNANDNVDLDYDNDGIPNCTESYGNQPIDISNLNAGTLNVNSGAYVNSFTGNVTTSATASPTPFTGNTDGSFVSEVPAGITNFVKYEMSFTQPITLGMDYSTTANPTDLLNSDAQFVVNSPINKTITVLNPSNQLLIDTNYDGIYESGITEFSSFEIRFRLNSTVPLTPGSGTFKFVTYQSNTISFTHKNLSDSNSNRATFKFYAVCVPRDSDNDGIPDDKDADSDNDGIPDFIEAQGSTFTAFTNADSNNDGIDNAYANGLIPIDTDNDGIPDYLDLDSDNDGIFDVIEAGNTANTTNTSGIILPLNVGANGLDDALEIFPDSGILNYTIADTDADGSNNYIELDSDNDGCNDVIEAGFSDPDNNGILDSSPVTTSNQGTVISASGYGIPNVNYITAAPIVITTQPMDKSVCEAQAAVIFSIAASSITTYQWQVSTDGITWTDIVNNTTYSNATTENLTITNAGLSMNNYKYRVFLNRNGNSCGLYSATATLTILALPVITSPIILVQCDNDTDGISTFNLTQKNNTISANFATETFTYYTTSVAAENQDTTLQILNPTTYTTSNTTVFVRVQNSNSCYRIAQLNLVVSVTQIPSSVVIADFVKCDDFVDTINDDHDGIASFDFSSVTTQILNALPATSGPYTLNYYKNEADFLSETDTSGNSLAIPATQITNYRNIGYPNQQEIWARVESASTNDCFGFRKFNLIVEALPIINPVGINNIVRHCDDNQDGTYIFDTSTIEATILGTQTNKTISYLDESGNVIPSPFPATYSVTTSQIITVKIQNNATVAADAPCTEEGTFQFIVDDLPEAFALSTTQIASLITCDDETDPQLQNGTTSFDTTGIEATIVGSQTGMLIKYTYEDGTSSTALANPFVTETQNVIVRITNPINPDCYAEETLHFIVNPLPKIDLNLDGDDNVIVCANLPGNIITLTADLTDTTPTNNYTYQWYINSVAILGATNYTLNINTPGTYTVDVTNTFGCKRTRTIEAIPSDIAEIETIQINDLSDNNSVIINVVSGTGGNYVYSLDAEFGPFQTSNIFENVSYGFHFVYIKDLNGCDTTKKMISVLGVPKFFTPNGDGNNDTWNIRGVSSQFYPNTIVYIYDRYGKILAQISPLGAGWDGTYNGNLALSDDYWYYIKVDDGRVAKGHFSLKR